MSDNLSPALIVIKPATHYKIDGSHGRKFNYISYNFFKDNLLTVTCLDSWSILVKILNATDFLCMHHKSDYLLLCPLYRHSLSCQSQAYGNHESALSHRITNLDRRRKLQHFERVSRDSYLASEKISFIMSYLVNN